MLVEEARKLGDKDYALKLMDKLLERNRKVAKRIERFDPDLEMEGPAMAMG